MWKQVILFFFFSVVRAKIYPMLNYFSFQLCSAQSLRLSRLICPSPTIAPFLLLEQEIRFILIGSGKKS